MTTYQHGQQPDGAPVTWQRVGCSVHGTVYELNDTVHWSMFSSEESADEACRAFHLAKLAEEAASMLGRSPLTPNGTTDWLRRYREAVR